MRGLFIWREIMIWVSVDSAFHICVSVQCQHEREHSWKHLKWSAIWHLFKLFLLNLTHFKTWQDKHIVSEVRLQWVPYDIHENLELDWETAEIFSRIRSGEKLS